MSKKGLALLLTFVFVAGIVLAGCGSGDKKTAGGAGNVLVFGAGSDPRGLDPAFVDDGESMHVMDQIYEGLVRYKPGSTEIMPSLATEWSVSPDGKEITFKLREGVKFHDGTPFNAEAVKVSFERQLPPQRKDDMPYADFTFDGVTKVEAVDEHTVKITLKAPSAPFLANMAMMISAPIVSPAAVKKYGDKLMENPVGTGPYKFVKWDKGQQIELAAFDGYWGDKPKMQKIVFKFIKENSVRASELMTGAVDIMDGVDTNDVKTLESKGMKVLKAPGMNINYMAFYTNKKPFDNPDLRKAISMAINRQNLVDYLYQGNAQLPNSILPDFIPGYSKDVKPYDYNPEEAKKLLAKAGYPDGFEFTAITYSNPRPYNPVNGEKLAAAVQADLAKIGVKMNIKSYPWKEYKPAYINSEGDAMFYGWIGDNGDADNFLMLLETAQIKGSLNTAKYSNPKLDELIMQGRTTIDPATRAAIYAEVQKIAVEDAPWVLISHSVDMRAERPNIKGDALHPTNNIWLGGVSKE
ncbi:MAG TPA: ABC transporter substrate-binding protein [Methylomusa anaerophila]|uniref:Periplasmic dipeptide transport protein n=1 Tax=Methylomusa anaerophila TaxID=1930071 RepID=A0A348AIB4_9FIRM|nr:ABC transporter substrate-binding protein [Methylomusa anaerophila]BBB90812.1 periplasmic dipeptide transport protein precursor [Methylomusa anaerophila]HML90531.1 ABC transporter substrate-binding protein [Methylomusa anaerophila]